jgi:uncharacterized protein YPO0396
MMIQRHYGMALPIRVLSREDQIRIFEEQNKDLFPCWCWDYISKNTHLMLLWIRTDICVDLIVRWHGQLRFVQDIIFKDVYSNAREWHMAVKELLDDSDEVYIVFHDD